MRISVLGAGAWGTALAASAARRHAVLLWARDAEQAVQMRQARRNQRYLSDVELPLALQFSDDLQAALAHAHDGLLVVATPMAALRNLLQRIPGRQPVLWLCKGFESGTGALAHEVARQERGDAPCGVLSGPSFAIEVARGQPTALVIASVDSVLRAAAVDAFHGDGLRIYTSADVPGVEVGGAVKNVMAIAVGLLDGLAAAAPPGMAAPGLNARAALITRGLAEMTRLGLAMGAQVETFMGLAGLGDLVLTSTGQLSRNRQVGLLLAAGVGLADALHSLGHVAEGVHSAATVLSRARALQVDMPITTAVVGVLDGALSPVQALQHLMARGARPEVEAS